MSGEEWQLAHLADDAADGASGVPHEAELLGFAEAVVRGDGLAVAETRGRLVEAIGPEAALDAAAVVAAFHVVTRIADATGIPLDRDMYERSAELRAQMGLERLEPDRIG
jgi:hypothetical protein